MSALPPVVCLTSLDTLVVTGDDRVSWLNGLVTCDLLRMDRGAYGFAVSKVGRVLSDVVVVADGDRLVVGVAEGRGGALAEELGRFLVMEDAELADETAGLAWLLAHGDVPGLLALPASAPMALGPDGGGAACVPRARAAAVAEELGGVSLAEFSAARIRRGVPTFGVDFSEKTYPQETGVAARAVSFSKGCYLGQEVVCRLEMRGRVHRKLVHLVLEGEAPAVGAAVRSGDADVGEITSTAPIDGASHALAMVKSTHAEPGGCLFVDGRAAEVSPAA